MNDMADQSAPEKLSKESYQSELPTGRERFLAYVIEHGLNVGCRTPTDFIRHFSPSTIMAGLQDQPELRAEILTPATGIKQKVAIKKTWQSCGDDLQIALDEQETDESLIVSLFRTDDRVRYLDSKALWTYMIEGQFWMADPRDEEAHSLSRAHLAYLLDCALGEDLITHRDIVDGISVEKLAELLPRELLGKVIGAAFSCAHAGRAFAEVDLLSEIPSAELVQHIPLVLIWQSVVVPKIAQLHGFTDRPLSIRSSVSVTPAPNQDLKVTTESMRSRRNLPEMAHNPEVSSTKNEKVNINIMDLDAIEDSTNPGAYVQLQKGVPVDPSSRR